MVEKELTQSTLVDKINEVIKEVNKLKKIDSMKTKN